ncbi:MAG TPA: helix-turn-helix transcriptional regulator [Gemmataceae bacterium]|nr:helix-turn-helix transcriptional regulator [Gemmataceae bacterium]
MAVEAKDSARVRPTQAGKESVSWCGNSAPDSVRPTRAGRKVDLLSGEQQKEVHETLRKNKELQKQTAAEMRKQGKTQQEVAAAIGVPQQTLSRWEEDVPESEATNTQMGNGCLPDCRIIIPKKEYDAIYERVKEGASHKDASVEEHNAAVKIKAKVEHRLGQVLRETVKHGGHNKKQPTTAVGCSTGQLPDEITYNQSSRTQALARIPWELIEEKIEQKTAQNEKVSQARIVKELLQEQQRADNQTDVAGRSRGDAGDTEMGATPPSVLAGFLPRSYAPPPAPGIAAPHAWGCSPRD